MGDTGDGGFGSLQGSLGDGGTYGGVGEADAPSFDSRMGYDGGDGGYGFGGSSSYQPQLADIFNIGDLQAPQYGMQSFDMTPEFGANLGVSEPTGFDQFTNYWDKYSKYLKPIGMGLGAAARLGGFAVNPLLGTALSVGGMFANNGGPKAQASPTGKETTPTNSPYNLDPGLLAAGRFGNVATNYQTSRELGAQQKGLSDLYSPTGAYAQQLESRLMARDAAAGRRSQYGSRAVQLQAALADAASRNAGTQRQLTLDKQSTNLNNVRDTALFGKSLYDIFGG